MKKVYALSFVVSVLFSLFSCAQPDAIQPVANSARTKLPRQPVVVILGSSTAAGFGASSYNRSWAGLLGEQLKDAKLINLAKGGYTTYHMLPTTGAAPRTDRPAVDTLRNITAALRRKPDLILISMTTNDVALGYGVNEVMKNLESVWEAARRAGVAQVYISTSIPRKLNPTAIRQLKEQRTKTLNRFGANALNFYDRLADANGLYKPQYNADDVHPNNSGHQVLFEEVQRVLAGDASALRGGRSRTTVSQ